MASSAAGRSAVGAAKVVKPILSRDLDEAKRRVRELYRAWYREVPNTGRLERCERCQAVKNPPDLQGRVSVEAQPGGPRREPDTGAPNPGSAGDAVRPLPLDVMAVGVNVGFSVYQHQR